MIERIPNRPDAPKDMKPMLGLWRVPTPKRRDSIETETERRSQKRLLP
jgi:hypothetical protein